MKKRISCLVLVISILTSLFVVMPSVANADTHKYGDGVVTLEPTHVTEGVMTYTCICGDTYTETIPTTPDHEYDDGVITTPATHTTEGVMTYTCICGDTKTEVIPADADAHTWDDGVVTQEPTHTTEGVMTHTCICGDTYTETIPTTPDHEYDDGVVTQEPTHTVEGVKIFTCICGDTYTETIPTTPDHEYDEGVVTIPATHTTEGVMTYTCFCGDTYTEVIPAGKDAHEYGDAIYVNEEQHQKVCECGDMIYEAHTWDEGKIALKPTATTDGVMMYTCECGEIKYVIIPAVIHNYIELEEIDGETHKAICECGDFIVETHNWDNGVVVTEPEVGKQGVKLYTCECGAQKFEVLPALSDADGAGENYCPHFGNGVVTTAPTHTTAGIKTYTCILCGATYTEEIPVNEYAHNYAEFEEIDEETHKLICECGDFIFEEHAWDEGVVVTEPEVGKEGVKIYTCECGAHKFEVLPALPGSGDTTGGTTCGSGETTPSTETILTAGSGVAMVGKEITVPISISSNAGVTGLQLACEYTDDVLTLTGVKKGDALLGMDFTNTTDLCENPVILLWDGMDADYSNGEIALLTFRVADNAEPGEYRISLNVEVACGQEIEDIPVTVEDGILEIIEYKVGDSNNDGVISVKDVVVLRRRIADGYEVEIQEKAADANQDGAVNVKDIVLIRRYIAGGYGVEL